MVSIEELLGQGEDFDDWFHIFLEEKGIKDLVFEFEDNKCWNYIPIDVIIQFLSMCDEQVQQQIKNKLVELDFCNMNIAHFLEYIAKGLVRIQNS